MQESMSHHLLHNSVLLLVTTQIIPKQARGHNSRPVSSTTHHNKPPAMSFTDFDFTLSSHSPSPPPLLQRTPTPFTPTNSKYSPLTPRCHYNDQFPLHESLLLSDQQVMQKQPFSSPPPSPPPLLKFAKIDRKHKPNPVLLSKENLREKRRGQYLQKLSDAREQSRMSARGGEDEVCVFFFFSLLFPLFPPFPSFFYIYIVFPRN